MKKILFVVIGVILVLGIVALSVMLFRQNSPGAGTPTDTSPTGSIPTTIPPTSSTTSPSESTQPTGTAPNVQANGALASASLPIVQETDTADDGTVIFTHTFQDVVLCLENDDTARSVTLDLLQRMDANSAKLAQLQDAAYRDYSGQDSWRSYYYSILYSVRRVDSSILSLYGTEEFYGSGESETNGFAVTYDLTMGTVLTLEDVIRDDTSVYDSLLQALLTSLELSAEEFQLYDDYKDIVSSDFRNYLSESESWYLSTDGLCFLFSPYYIAPNAAGIVTATVPYAQLSGILQESYFPASQPEVDSEIMAEDISSVDLDRFQRFCELKNAVNGTPVVLYSKGIPENVQIERGHIVGTSRYVADATVFLANRLSPGDALLLEDAFDGSSVLKLRFSIGSAVRTYLIEKDASGKIVLIPEA